MYTATFPEPGTVPAIQQTLDKYFLNEQITELLSGLNGWMDEWKGRPVGGRKGRDSPQWLVSSGIKSIYFSVTVGTVQTQETINRVRFTD